MVLFFNIFTVVLLALVAGLLMALWFQLRDWRKSVRQAPLLAEQLAEQLLAARHGLDELKKSLLAHGPELSHLLSEGGKARVELELLLQRADQFGQKMEKAPVGGTVTENALTSATAVVEQVAGANGQAIQPVQVARDPLEDLLAGLQQYEEVPGDSPLVKKSPAASKRKRVGPVTQAELDLQRKVAQ